MNAQENELLCKVGPGTATGELMRSYWLPAFLSDELERDGAPKRTRMLGEDFVGFRDSSGRVGLLDENCPHRGASLVLARNEACGLRCLYHGWKIDVTGTVLETPPEPDELGFKDRVRAIAYPTYEAGGIVWAYLGAPNRQPPPLDFEWTSLPDSHVMLVKGRIECNWAQGLEGSIDTVHSNLLHQDSIRPTTVFLEKTVTDGQYYDRPAAAIQARIEIENTTYGFRYAAIRKPVRDADTTKYVRITHYVAPTYVLFPGAAGWCSMAAYTPIDDEHTMFYWARASYGAPISPETREIARSTVGLTVGVDVNADYSRKRTRANNWMQDRDAMRRGDSHTGISGVIAEDMSVEESMGPLLNRAKEHLGTSDAAIIRMRQLMIDAARRLKQDGGPALGLAQPTDYGRLRADEALMPLDEPWQNLVEPSQAQR